MELAAKALPVHVRIVASTGGAEWHMFSPCEFLLHCKTVL